MLFTSQMRVPLQLQAFCTSKTAAAAGRTVELSPLYTDLLLCVTCVHKSDSLLHGAGPAGARQALGPPPFLQQLPDRALPWRALCMPESPALMPSAAALLASQTGLLPTQARPHPAPHLTAPAYTSDVGSVQRLTCRWHSAYFCEHLTMCTQDWHVTIMMD